MTHATYGLYHVMTVTAVAPIARPLPRPWHSPAPSGALHPAGGPRRIRVGIIGATGYVGGELIRLLARHPNVEIVGPRRVASATTIRSPDPPAPRHHRADRRCRRSPRTGVDRRRVPGLAPREAASRSSWSLPPPAPRSSTSAPISASATPPTTRAGTASSTRGPSSSTTAVYGLPGAASRRARGPRRRARSPSSGHPAATRPQRSSRCSRLRTAPGLHRRPRRSMPRAVPGGSGAGALRSSSSRGSQAITIVTWTRACILRAAGETVHRRYRGGRAAGARSRTQRG